MQKLLPTGEKSSGHCQKQRHKRGATNKPQNSNKIEMYTGDEIWNGI